MDAVFAPLIQQCQRALGDPDPQGRVASLLLEAMQDPDLVPAIANRTRFSNLADLAIHRSDDLTVLAGSLPPGFSASPHNHNLWSVVGVCAGREDNRFYERDGDGLRQVGEASVEAPGVLANGAEVIHAIRNPLDAPLMVLHVYGGDLFATQRSHWDPETHEEIPFRWEQVRSGEDDAGTPRD